MYVSSVPETRRRELNRTSFRFAHAHRSLRVFLLELGLRLLVPSKSVAKISFISL
ncbi:hypothetical protein OSO01_18720 [Oceanobacillus sojae]|uniref:Uncharacterized protein n=1 Tax=Oceanobacillus sojae TaxID=582851 RepID=A0A511ZI67_9BACI|nr:hypothetical protein OSO01_18720 [Oceanobacillus sojae]